MKDSLRLDIVSNICSNMLLESELDIEKLHIILSTIGDVQRCLLYNLSTQSNLTAFEPYMQLLPRRIENDDFKICRVLQTLNFQKFILMNKQIAIQFPILGESNKCMGKLLFIFCSEKSLYDPVKIECLLKIQRCLTGLE